MHEVTTLGIDLAKNVFECMKIRQAALLLFWKSFFVSSIPSLNFTSVMTFAR